jgi:predicted HicB family RNase H-like nuclease
MGRKAKPSKNASVKASVVLRSDVHQAALVAAATAGGMSLSEFIHRLVAKHFKISIA